MLQRLIAVDSAVRDWLAFHHSSTADAMMLVASAVGRRGAIWLVLGLAVTLIRPQLAAGAWQLVLALILSSVVTDSVIKPIVARNRPFVTAGSLRVIDERPPTSSFPSGHSATAFAGAFALGRMWPAARAPLWVLAVIIALSRVYVGVHYPSDVLAGALIGLGGAYLVAGTTACYSDRSPSSSRVVPR